jgi:hypothetical protein
MFSSPFCFHDLPSGNAGQRGCPKRQCRDFFHATALSSLTFFSQPGTTPSFRAFFSTSYGLSRDQLEDLNFLIKSSNSMAYVEYCGNPRRLGYDMSLFVGQSQPKPSVVLLKDSLILAEVFGAGFTKAPGGKVCLLLVDPRRLLTAECLVQISITNFGSHG